MERILVSACLVGQRVRYNATDATAAWKDLTALQRWQSEGRVVPFCPELAGGFPVPRPPAEISGGEGREVLVGTATVNEQTGADVTTHFVRGAQLALQEAQRLGIRIAVLKEGSPSCGVHLLYSGNFSGQTKHGRGVTATLLEQNGIHVFSENEDAQVNALLRSLEHGVGGT